MLNQWLRYIPIACLVKKTGCETILEVGGGAKGIGNYLTGITIIGADIRLAKEANPSGESLLPVAADAIKLPFRDGAFGVVVCVDMLEHIAFEERGTAIRELLRVSGGKLILAFPADEKYGRWERRIVKMYQLFKKDKPDWLIEHIGRGLPRKKHIEAILTGLHATFVTVPNENNVVHLIAMALDESPASKLFRYIVDIMAPERWKFGKRSIWHNMARVALFPARQLPRILSFGSTVRKIYIVSKI